MGHIVWLKGLGAPPKNAINSFTFPALSVELTPEIIEHCKLGPALQRLGQILMKKYPRAGGRGQPTIGIDFGDLEFCFQLGEYKESKPTKEGA